MANNGSSALRTLEPPTAPAPDVCGKIELEIGQAVAAAARVLAAAMWRCQQTGRLDPELKEVGGEHISKVVRLQLSTFGEIDFYAVARREGRRALLPLLRSPEFDSGQAASRVLEIVVDGVLEIARGVMALEMARATN